MTTPITIKHKLKLESKFFTEKTIILGVSGYGKSYTARKIIEASIENNIPLVIINPQGAYENLGDRFTYIYAEDAKDPKALGLLVGKTNKSVVICVKELTVQAQNTFLHKFLLEYKRHQNVGIKCLVVDELHKYALESLITESKGTILGMIQENRSDGLGFIGISQMPAVISKTPIKQASNKFIGYMEEYNDIKAVKGFLSDGITEEDIKKLDVGEFFIKLTAKPAVIDKIAEVKTQHSGQTPKNLLNEDTDTFNKYFGKIYKNSKKTKGGKSMAENPVKQITDVLPSQDAFMNLAGLGAKVALGGVVTGIVGNVVSPFVQRFNPLKQYVSGRTVGALGTTIALYAVYRKVGEKSRFKDVLKYATAGSAVYTLGSAIFDVIAVTKLPVPILAQNVISMASGVSPVQMEQIKGVDVNTAMA